MADVAITLPGFGRKGIGACRRPDLVPSKFIETAGLREYYPARMCSEPGWAGDFQGATDCRAPGTGPKGDDVTSQGLSERVSVR